MSASRTGQSKKQNRVENVDTPHPACGHLLPSAEKGGGDLLTQEELAARLKVGLRTLVRLQHDGAIPFIVLGKSVRFFWPAVVSHLNANSTICGCANKGGRP